jgi:hypothetical protein
MRVVISFVHIFIQLQIEGCGPNIYIYIYLEHDVCKKELK